MAVPAPELSRLSRKTEETRLGWAFIAAMVLFIAALVAVGTLLRLIW